MMGIVPQKIAAFGSSYKSPLQALPKAAIF
ncbi:hypothetical protein BSF40_25950 [Pseudomonas sp. ACN5]|nr:hypothetical protein BSF40_25950 [Pseudomonas sp. ACN5]